MDDELDDIVKRGKGFMSNWKIDKAHSTIGFEVRHMMISKVRGEFNSFEAKIEAEDLSNLENAEISFTICTDSITTHHLDRDNHLKSSDFFDVHRHPTITFSSTHIKKLTDNDRYQVQGDLTIKGITETVVFDVLFSGRAINPWGDEVYGFEAEAHLNREDFSLLWNAALETGGVLVGKEVTIVVQLEIIKENVSDVTNTDDSKQFYLVYQPKVKITTNEVVGMEALVRWNHPELGVIPPNKFIPLAEETGLIIPLGEWILKESCRQAVEWEELGYSLLNLSVNISVRQLEDVQFVNKLKAILKETGMDPMRLELEITESILVNAKSAINLLKEIRELGVKISVDDFGTGYSSLSYLKELPIDTIKIDQSFIKDIHVNNDSKEIARALINLANSIGLNAIAEGIEQKEHVEQLKEDGYQLGQGYFYSKPLKPDAFEAYLKEEHEVS